LTFQVPIFIAATGGEQVQSAKLLSCPSVQLTRCEDSCEPGTALANLYCCDGGKAISAQIFTDFTVIACFLLAERIISQVKAITPWERGDVGDSTRTDASVALA
jgi:hypothetical protein